MPHDLTLFGLVPAERTWYDVNMTTTTTTDDTYELEVCSDCLMLIANGDMPLYDPETGEDFTEEGAEAWGAEFDRINEGRYVCASSWPYTEREADAADTWRVFTEPEAFRLDEDGTTVMQHDWSDGDRYYGYDTESTFSMSSCDTCGSRLGGDRFPASAWAN